MEIKRLEETIRHEVMEADKNSKTVKGYVKDINEHIGVYTGRDSYHLEYRVVAGSIYRTALMVINTVTFSTQAIIGLAKVILTYQRENYELSRTILEKLEGQEK